MSTTLKRGRRRVRADVVTQRGHDIRRTVSWPQYHARHEAVIEALGAVRRGEPGARYALRQALVDLAACCERIAEPMIAPDVDLT